MTDAHPALCGEKGEERAHLAVALDLLESARIQVRNAGNELEISWRAGEGISGLEREELLQLCSDIGDDVGNFPGFVSQEDSSL